MKSCLGGWCKRREFCAHYQERGLNPVERLCEPSRDGVPKPMFSIDGSKAQPIQLIEEPVTKPKDPAKHEAYLAKEREKGRAKRAKARAAREAMPKAPRNPAPFSKTVLPVKTVGFKAEAEIVIPPGLKITQCPSAWKDKPLPEPDAAIPKREGAEDWRKCGRGMF